MIEATIPFPPSVNRYWRNVQGRTLISKDGRKYKDAVSIQARIDGWVKKINTAGRLAVSIEACAPDKRRRDLDNLLKASLDAMAHGCGFDDSQIDKLMIERGPVEKGGFLIVRIWNVAPQAI